MTLEELKAQIKPGWTVRIIDHQTLSEGRDKVKVEEVREDGLLLRPSRPWSSQGRTFPTYLFTWDGDLEVEGFKVHRFWTPTAITSRSTPGVRQVVKTFVFSAPKGY